MTAAATTLLLRPRAEATQAKNSAPCSPGKQRSSPLFFFSGFCDNKLSVSSPATISCSGILQGSDAASPDPWYLPPATSVSFSRKLVRGPVEIKIPISSLCFGFHCRSVWHNFSDTSLTLMTAQFDLIRPKSITNNNDITFKNSLFLSIQMQTNNLSQPHL
ncbi:hypothetical protein AAC387_Pa07g3624 [Persea americana]